MLSQASGWTTVDRAEATREQKHRPLTKSNPRILPLKICHCGVRRHNKIDHPDRPETTEGHHADHYTDDIGPDQHREDEGQRAACSLDADCAKIATQLIDLETAERVLTRVSKTPPARRLRSASAAEAKASNATRGRGRPPRSATSKSAGREPSARNLGLGERVLALATGKTRQELYAACPSDRPNHVGMAVQRHIRAGQIQERDGKLYATPTATEQAHATA